MRFLLANNRVKLSVQSQDFSCTIEEFQQLEADFEYTPGAVESWEPSRRYLAKDGNQQASPYNRSGYLTLEKIQGYEAALSALQPEPEPNPATIPTPNWENALIAIHDGLASASPTCPFCQIRLWADSDLTLDARVKDFTAAFLQPMPVRAGAVQSGLDRVWTAMDTTQQTTLNTADIATWNAAHNLGLALPWEQT